MRKRTAAGAVQAAEPDLAHDDDKLLKAQDQEQQRRLALLVGGFLVLAPFLAAVVFKLRFPDLHVSKTFTRPQVHRGFGAEEVHSHLRNHTLLHIGGLHRSGANLFWEGLHRHPNISGHSHKDHTDDRVKPHVSLYKHEGLKLQSVYPKYGLDHPRQHKFRKWVGQIAKRLPLVDETVFPWVRLREGVGRFALNPEHHLDEATPLISEQSQLQLFNQWALFWDLEHPVLMENSPTNLVIAPFLHRLWGLGMTASPARFVFLRRHPIAVAMSTLSAGGRSVDDLSVADLVEHWVAAEERLAADLQQYFQMGSGPSDARGSTYRILSLEAVLQAPRRKFEELIAWLGLPSDEKAAEAFEASAKKDPNARYFGRYCMALLSGGESHMQAHTELVARFGEQVRKVEPSYDLSLVAEMCKRTLIHGTPAVTSTEDSDDSAPQEDAEVF